MGIKVVYKFVLLALLIGSVVVNRAHAQEASSEAAQDQAASEASKPVASKKNSLEVARPDDILLMVWSSKVAISSYFDACLSYAPGSVDDVIEMKDKWDRRNRKVVANLEKYMQKYVELTMSDLSPSETYESRLAQMTEDKSAKIRNSISRSPEQLSQLCQDLGGQVSGATSDFLDLYKSNRKAIRSAYN